ncbi:CLUMA_CG014502, isoform A [Clunio marinus]|uniref:CLUMA_CG014502, isoform A n=1 Tax=Clunio marinus TaxID=568069 RepID=A0A1J1IPM0_9DIPT|nr:CLUMA_CG014502, isoform A [Clunio marinus]
MEKSSKLWGDEGRFSCGLNSDLSQLNNSLQVDKRLYREDICGSLAYAEVLCDAEIISSDEFKTIKEGLNIVLDDWNSHKIQLRDNDEDIHSVNERRLIEIVGDVGRKLHTGRSRNDQVVLDMKLWMKKSVIEIVEDIKCLIKVFIRKAEDKIKVIMPGYTHLQRAQPVRFSHWLLAHGFFLESDCDRLKQLLERVDVMPLGSGALAGNPFKINRDKLAKLLGFSKITNNSMNAVSDRDFVGNLMKNVSDLIFLNTNIFQVEFNFIATLISTHLSRLSEDLILFNTKEFNFIKLSGEFATGSSLMPQKFNPDCLELVRGLTGGILGQLTNILVTLKGLPFTYNKDLQSDKQSMFFVFDNIKLSLKVISGVVESMEILDENCWNALSYDMLATDVAYYLVRKGVAFRDAHHSASKLVDYASQHCIELCKLPLPVMKTINEKFIDDVHDIWSFTKSVEQYQATGGTSMESVRNQIAYLKDYVERGN